MWSLKVFTFIVVVSVVAAHERWSQPHKIKPIEEVAKEMGYEIERHDITTADGYILTYHRLPRGRNLSEADNEVEPESRKVLLFSNGILMSSATVLVDRRDLAYALADAGFDVWLGNYRGNVFSRRHRSLNPDRDKQFWNYSLDELGTKDLPASIDYILDKTGASKLLYVGFSMGTTMFWVLGSALPQYMDKVEAMVAIAPVARTSHMHLLKNSLRQGAARAAVTGMEELGFREMLRYNEALSSLIYSTCTRYHPLRALCKDVLRTYNLIFGDVLDPDRIIEMVKYHPAGISTKVLLHYIQLARARKFQQFDYGLAGNSKRYKSDNPPQYDLKNVNCNIYLVNADVDWVAAKQDVEWLTEQLPKKPTRILQDKVNHLGHVDLGLDKQALDLLVKPLTAFLKERFLDSSPAA